MMNLGRGWGLAWTSLAALACGGAPARAQEPAGGLAHDVLEARYSKGFEIRFQVSSVQPEEGRGPGAKIAAIGEMSVDGGRLLTRRIAGELATSHSLVARSDAQGRVTAVRFSAEPGGRVAETDALSAQPYSGLFLWDMLAPWLRWADQKLTGKDQIDGHPCTLIISRAQSRDFPIQSVTSCVDVKNLLTLRTVLRDSSGNVIRRIDIEQTMRQSSGRLTAKKMRITRPDRPALEVEIYAGDEHYDIDKDTFSALDREERELPLGER